MPTRPTLPRLDPAPFKDMARSLRFVAERGSRTLQKSLPLDVLPNPAARVADAALATALRVGQRAEQSVSAFAHALLDDDSPPPPLDHVAEVEGEARFAVAAHDALRGALAQLGAESSLVSETAARRAWRAVATGATGQSDSATAAALFLSLTAAHTVREAVWHESTALPHAEAAAIATFAVLLAMLAEPAQFRALLPSAVDITLALRADLLAATDAQRLAALFDEFRNHV
jgi:hypothetical protein